MTAERFFEKSRQELIGRHCWEIVHGTSEPIPECPTLRVKQSLGRESMELPIGDRWFEVTVDPILNEEGSYAGAVHIVSDITDRKQAEEELRKSEEKIRATLDATPFPIAVVDPHDDTIFFWSRSALELFGHTAPTASEWYQMAYPDPDYRQDVIERWKPFLEKARNSGQTINTGEYRVTCKDGSERICEIYATFLPDSLFVTFNDITERKRMEAKILALSITDQLTGLHNRRGFLSLAKQQLKLTERNKRGV